MAIIEARTPLALEAGPADVKPLGVFARPTGAQTGWKSWVTTVDHKKIGIMYGVAVDVLLRHRRRRGAAHPPPARPPGQQAALGRPVQPGLHDARRHHGLPRRHADGGRVRELPPAAADRRPRRGVPPAQRLQLLVLPVRRRLLQLVAGSSAAAPTAAGSTTPPTTA